MGREINRETKHNPNKGRKFDAMDVAHYNNLWKVCLMQLMNSYLNKDEKFANKIKATWQMIRTQMKELGMDEIKLYLFDFSDCNNVEELVTWMENKTIMAERGDYIQLRKMLASQGVTIQPYATKKSKKPIDTELFGG